MFLIPVDEDVFVVCPYDKKHRVPRSRLQRHLIKCEKVYPELAICPYNATHRIPNEMKLQHSVICPSKPKTDPLPKHKNAMKVKGGAVFPPTVMHQEDYMSKDDPNYESWD